MDPLKKGQRKHFFFLDEEQHAESEKDHISSSDEFSPDLKEKRKPN